MKTINKLLFPAGAGVIPYRCQCVGRAQTVPRRGGGDPVVKEALDLAQTCSPQGRG